jgi:hypothetical protein
MQIVIVIEEEGIEELTGFRQLRGTIDGLFAASIELQKRKEHYFKNLGAVY